MNAGELEPGQWGGSYRGPFVRVLGVVDELGRLWCVECRNFVEFDRGFVWSDQSAHVDEECDGCARTLRAVEAGRQAAAV